jgi:hypothetical protein
MPIITTVPGKQTIKSTNSSTSKCTTLYRGFASIGQEIEREIAMQWFNSSSKSSVSHKSFLLKK